MKTKILFLFLAVSFTTPMAAESKGGLVACVGDSITYGSGTTYPSRESYPAQLQGMLQQQDPAWRVLNYGFGGATLLHKGDKPYINQGAYQGALASNHDVVVIKLGTNDSKPQNWTASTTSSVQSPCSNRAMDRLRSLPGSRAEARGR